MLRQAAVVAAVLALGWACIRSAAVASSTERRPELAQSFWPSHPLPTTTRALQAIGAAAARGQTAPDAALHEMSELASRDPLADEPFTVAGTAALAQGRSADAERLLKEAIERDPRSLAPRYLLADLALRTGNVEAGLEQVLFLTKQVGRMAEPIAPGLAAFARQPGGVERLRPLLRRSPATRDAVLSTLAADPNAVEVVLALAEPTAGEPTPETRAWQSRLLGGMVDRGDYGGAYRTWLRLAGMRASEPGLFNPDFREHSAPPPFNWSLASSSAGTAEPIEGGGLRLLFYGREEAVLASQLLLLPAGRYRLEWQAVGSSDNLSVRVSCLPGDRVLAIVELGKGQLALAVPPECRAQRLEFRGALSELPSTVQPTITALRLTRDGR